MRFSGYLLLVYTLCLPLKSYTQGKAHLESHYTKQAFYIPMRDSVRLYTIVFAPKDNTRSYPIILCRTPYKPFSYNMDEMPDKIGPSEHFVKDGYIIVYQNTRGRFMSEGTTVNLTPHIPNKSSTQTDNSTDTYDTVEWLLKHINNHNGKVGLWGISYRGFLVSSGIINTHPAIKCASPQAPITDMFIRDDFHHNGAFALHQAFFFYDIFKPADTLFQEWPEPNLIPVKDSYHFFLNAGKLNDFNQTYFNNNSAYWDSMMLHPNYDYYWIARNILPHLYNITCPLLTVGGWYDAEDLAGTLQTYYTIENLNPEIENILVMGPWEHGGWVKNPEGKLGDFDFGKDLQSYYQKEIELPFFNHYLKDGPNHNLPEAFMYDTGKKKWMPHSKWPPQYTVTQTLYMVKPYSLRTHKPNSNAIDYESYISDPNRPVPYTAQFHSPRIFYNREYMIEDQRFASARADLLSFSTDRLSEDITVAGPVHVTLYFSTTGTDADFIVKIIDEFPESKGDNSEHKKAGTTMAGYQMLVRAEIFRAKYRESYEHPEPLIPGKITKLHIELPDIYHTFLTGHKIMLQVQSSWFPLYNRNPQQFMNIYEASAEDYKREEMRVFYSSNKYPSSVKLKVVHKDLWEYETEKSY